MRSETDLERRFTVVIPPPETMREAARYMEHSANKQGWDGPPHLLLLLGKQLDGAFAVMGEELPFAEQIPDGDTPKWLRMMADDMAPGRRLARAARSMASESFCGAAMVYEGWGSFDASGEEAAADLAPHRSFADHPEAKEARCVTIVDTAGNLHQLVHERGRKGLGYIMCNPDGWNEITDNEDVIGIAEALRDIVLRIAAHLPAGAADLDALRGAPA